MKKKEMLVVKILINAKVYIHVLITIKQNIVKKKPNKNVSS